MLLAFIAGFWVIAIAVILIFMKGAKGCGGNCEQGRKNCDCCDEWKK